MRYKSIHLCQAAGMVKRFMIALIFQIFLFITNIFSNERHKEFKISLYVSAIQQFPDLLNEMQNLDIDLKSTSYAAKNELRQKVSLFLTFLISYSILMLMMMTS